MQDVLRPVLVIGGTLTLTVLIGWLIDRLLRAADERRHDTRLFGLLRRCQTPLQLLLASSAVYVAYDAFELNVRRGDVFRDILATITIAASAWLVIRAAGAVAENYISRYEARTDDTARVRQFRTQLGMIRRGESAQQVGEQAGRELAGAPRAVAELGETADGGSIAHESSLRRRGRTGS